MWIWTNSLEPKEEKSRPQTAVKWTAMNFKFGAFFINFPGSYVEGRLTTLSSSPSSPPSCVRHTQITFDLFKHILNLSRFFFSVYFHFKISQYSSASVPIEISPWFFVPLIISQGWKYHLLIVFCFSVLLVLSFVIHTHTHTYISLLLFGHL